MYALMCWYMNVVVAMCLNDKINEAIQLIEQLDLIATKTEKKLLEKHKATTYEMLEKRIKIILNELDNKKIRSKRN